MKRGTELLMGLIMLMLVCTISNNLQLIFARAEEREKESIPMETLVEVSYTVVLDAGHGGMDGGKVSVDGHLEKDINLSIVMLLKSYLESDGFNVVLTREDGNGLYSESDENKKRADMNKRCSIIELARPVCVVSIHQNSYPDKSVRGPQVFYYKSSEEGRTLAGILQNRLNLLREDEKKREIKPNTDYYLLKNVSVPIVICECGFLSNPDEAAKLIDEKYQQSVAWEIYMGITEYVNTGGVAN